VQHVIEYLAAVPGKDIQTEGAIQFLSETENKLVELLEQLKIQVEGQGDEVAIAKNIMGDLNIALALPVLNQGESELPKPSQDALAFLNAGPDGENPLDGGDELTWSLLISWIIVSKLGWIAEEIQLEDKAQIDILPEDAESDDAGKEQVERPTYKAQSRTWIDEFLFGKIISGTLIDAGMEVGDAWLSVSLVCFLTSHQDWFENLVGDLADSYLVLRSWMQDRDLQRFLKVHRFQGVLWFNKEAFEALCWWAFVINVIRRGVEVGVVDEILLDDGILSSYKLINKLLEAAEVSDYQVEKLLESAVD